MSNSAVAFAKHVSISAFTVALVLNAVEAYTGDIANSWWGWLRIGVSIVLVAGLLAWCGAWFIEKRQNAPQ